MKIAYTKAAASAVTDLLLTDFAETLIRRGYNVAGLVQSNITPAGAHRCDMEVEVLPSRSRFQISQNLGHGSKGCRLNVGALEAAVGDLQANFDAQFDCLILNKFGKLEADGRGCRPLIGDAIGQDIPVLVGLNDLNQAAFDEFTGGMAMEVPPDPTALLDWIRAAQSQTHAA